MTPPADLLLTGGIIVPMDRDHHWFEGDLAVAGDTIAEVAPGSLPGAGLRPIDVSGCLVIPGFVQSHVHVVQSLLRHQADRLELLDWLERRSWPYEALLDGDGVEAAARLGIAELLSGGTTTILDMGTTHDHHRVFEAAAAFGIRMIGGKTHMDLGDAVPPGLLEDLDASLAEAESLGSTWHGGADGRLRYAVAPRFALSCSRDLLRGCADLARKHGWMLHSHASENRDEIAAVRDLTGMSNIAYLDSVGLTGPDVVLAHGVHLDDDEIARLAATGTRICHCPGANLKLASGIADLPRLIAAGVVVGLGADGAPCNNRLSVFHEMALAGTLHGLRHGPTAVDPWTVLALATRRGAEVLGLADLVGTLQTGKRADIAVIDLSDWSLLPAGDPASRLVYGATAAHVRHVFVDGRQVVENNRLCAPVDCAMIRQQCREAWRATASRMENAP